MGTNQKYSLRWNDFSLNVASTFRDLHSRQDFVDVTLACSDGSTLDAHKVILSSVSTYFRDILKSAPCKHPIIILKDTCREEASAMLEFAYTGEVNVGQELLPSLLHTARCFKIKGLDNVQTPPGLLDLNTSHSNDQESDHWAGSRPPTRPHTPSTRPHTPLTRSHTPSTRPHSPQSHPHSPNSVHSAMSSHMEHQSHDIKPFLPTSTTNNTNALNNGNGSSLIDHPLQHHLHKNHAHHLPPHHQHHHQQQPHLQQPPLQLHTASDLLTTANGGGGSSSSSKSALADHFLVGGPGLARATSGGSSAPPTRPSSPLIHSNSRTPPPKRWKRSFDLARNEEDSCGEEAMHYHANGGGGDYAVDAEAKRFCEKRFSTDSERRFAEADSATRRFAEPRMINSYPHSMPASPTMLDARNFNSLGLLRHLSRGGGDQMQDVRQEPREAHANSKVEMRNEEDALDYRFQVADQSQDCEKEKARHERLAFRPESAPTVLDMSPDGSRHSSLDGFHKHEHDERMNHFRSLVGGLTPMSSGQDSLADCLSKSLGSGGGGGGRYNCDECGKLFRHPGSLQHHRHIHRGTHRCPSCGKAFSRRWDMERHLNKSKYGCPANRFSSPGSVMGPEAGDAAAILAILPHATNAP